MCFSPMCPAAACRLAMAKTASLDSAVQCRSALRPANRVQAGWVAGPLGGDAFQFPEGVAAPLPKGSDSLLQVHFQLTGKPETERSTIGIYFADGPSSKMTASVELPTLFAFGSNIDIPAGEANYMVRAIRSRCRATSRFFPPAGTRTTWGNRCMCGHAAGWLYASADLHPQLGFQLAGVLSIRIPVELPKGTRLDATIR